MCRAVAAVNTSEFEGMPNVLLEAWSRGVPALVLHYDPGGVVRAHRLGLSPKARWSGWRSSLVSSGWIAKVAVARSSLADAARI